MRLFSKLSHAVCNQNVLVARKANFNDYYSIFIKNILCLSVEFVCRGVRRTLYACVRRTNGVRRTLYTLVYRAVFACCVTVGRVSWMSAIT